MESYLKNFLWVLMAFCLMISPLYAQKPAIDINRSDDLQWPAVITQTAKISPNGQYLAYTITNQPKGSWTTFIRSVDGKWQQHFISKPNTGDIVVFAPNSRKYLLFAEDSVVIGTLGSAEKRWIASRATSINIGSDQLLLYQRQVKDVLYAEYISNGKQLQFDSVRSFWPNSETKSLLIEKNNGQFVDLLLFNSITGRLDPIWTGHKIVGNPILDQNGTHIAFLVEDDKGTLHINAYKRDNAAFVKIYDQELNEKTSRLICFNVDGNKLFFSSLTANPVSKPNGTMPDVEVWSYKDPKLQTLQANELNRRSPDIFCANLEQGNAFKIAGDGENIISPQLSFKSIKSGYKLDLVLMRKEEGGDIEESNWNSNSRSSIYLISAGNGKRTFLGSGPSRDAPSTYTLSPNEKYVIFFDADKRSYFSYEVKTGTVRNLTHGIKTVWTSYNRDDEPEKSYDRMGYAGWLDDGRYILIYDQNDIWQLDPSNQKVPVNLTNKYGKKHGIQFRWTINNNPNDNDEPRQTGEQVLLEAFDRHNKNEGFFEIKIGKKADPELLTMGPYIYAGNQGINFNGVETTDPKKAQDASVYLLSRMSTTSAPNLFVSNDLKTFERITDVQPENKFNWLRSELITYPTGNGKTSQAILYKPENFDPKKRYPIIFYYYERLSDGLNAFLPPDPSGAVLDIPYFVSNGYLVCATDIHYTIGHPGQSALNSIVSAANYLAQRSYVDPKHMGLQGHSFGGFETEYIITHTQKFAAACAGSGWSDFINSYDAIRLLGNQRSRQYYFEKFRERIGATLWQRPDLYIENSPVLRANRVSTPLLMMNNKHDADVEFHFGVEFFIALRRLEKKVWMLQYNNGGHSLSDVIDKVDYDNRMKQFFDYYLKGASAPVWMTKGIPATQKQIDSGLEFDTSDIKP